MLEKLNVKQHCVRRGRKIHKRFEDKSRERTEGKKKWNESMQLIIENYLQSPNFQLPMLLFTKRPDFINYLLNSLRFSHHISSFSPWLEYMSLHCKKEQKSNFIHFKMLFKDHMKYCIYKKCERFSGMWNKIMY